MCPPPVISKVTDLDTSETRVVPIACGATRASKCKPCAERARKLRMPQCREGWHLDQEPDRPVPIELAAARAGSTCPALGAARRRHDDEDQGRRARAAGAVDPAPAGRPDLPGADDGPVHDRPGVHGAGRQGLAAVDVHHPHPARLRPGQRRGRAGRPGQLRLPARRARRHALLQAGRTGSGRTCAAAPATGSSTSPPSRASAAARPHLHAAVRGAIPRRVIRDVRAATYHQVWWPPHDRAVYDLDRLPPGPTTPGYVDPDRPAPLPTWDEALDQLDADPTPTGARGALRGAGRHQGPRRPGRPTRTRRSTTCAST